MTTRVPRHDAPNRLGETPRVRVRRDGEPEPMGAAQACSVCGSAGPTLVGYLDGVWRCIPHHRPETP